MTRFLDRSHSHPALPENQECLIISFETEFQGQFPIQTGVWMGWNIVRLVHADHYPCFCPVVDSSLIVCSSRPGAEFAQQIAGAGYQNFVNDLDNVRTDSLDCAEVVAQPG